MKIRKRQIQLFILLFAASSLLFQFPPDAFAATPSDISATDSMPNSASVKLNGPAYGATFTIGSSTYAIVTANVDDAVQIIDISDPENIVATDSMSNSASLELNGAADVDVFTIGSSTYAIVASNADHGVQIIDISDPTNITATDSMDNAGAGVPNLGGAYGVDTFVIGSSTYAIVAASSSDHVQIIDISDVDNIVAKDSATDDDADEETEFDELNGAQDVETFTIGSSTYAIVASKVDNGVQIIDISDPENIVAKDSATDGAGGFDELNDARGVDVFTIDSSTSTSTYAIVASYDDDAVQIIDISDPENIVATDAETDEANGFDELNGARGVETFIINSVVYAIVAGNIDDGVQMVELGNCASSDCVYTEAAASVSGSTSSTCARLVILGNCGTIAINNDEYRIIHPWSTIPTTEVMVGEPVSITISTPHNYAAGKINSVSVYTEILGSAADYELGSHIDYSVMKSDYYVSESELFQVAGATHRIVQDTDVKNLEMFEVVFTMIFAKPMDTSYIVVETKNMHGIPETIYLGNALKVIERPIELLTYEEKSKFKIISEPELKDSLRHDMDIEPDMDMLVVDPEPVVSKVTCGKGTMLKDNICVVDEMSFYFFVNQFMRFFG